MALYNEVASAKESKHRRHTNRELPTKLNLRTCKLGHVVDSL